MIRCDCFDETRPVPLAFPISRQSGTTRAMPPKRAAVEPEDTAPPSKKPSTEDAAAAIMKDASKITTSAKAAASGAESVPRTPTERRPRAANGLVLVHWNVGGLNGLLTGKSAVERKALLVNLVEKEQPDVLAISEHKLQQSKVTSCSTSPSLTQRWGDSEILALLQHLALLHRARC